MGHGLIDVIRAGTVTDVLAVMVDPGVTGSGTSSVDVGRTSEYWVVRWRIEGDDARGQGSTLVDALFDALGRRLALQR